VLYSEASNVFADADEMQGPRKKARRCSERLWRGLGTTLCTFVYLLYYDRMLLVLLGIHFGDQSLLLFLNLLILFGATAGLVAMLR